MGALGSFPTELSSKFQSTQLFFTAGFLFTCTATCRRAWKKQLWSFAASAAQEDCYMEGVFSVIGRGWPSPSSLSSEEMLAPRHTRPRAGGGGLAWAWLYSVCPPRSISHLGLSPVFCHSGMWRPVPNTSPSGYEGQGARVCGKDLCTDLCAWASYY